VAGKAVLFRHVSGEVFHADFVRPESRPSLNQTPKAIAAFTP
jgi:hypothetical protein